LFGGGFADAVAAGVVAVGGGLPDGAGGDTTWGSGGIVVNAGVDGDDVAAVVVAGKMA